MEEILITAKIVVEKVSVNTPELNHNAKTAVALRSASMDE